MIHLHWLGEGTYVKGHAVEQTHAAVATEATPMTDEDLRQRLGYWIQGQGGCQEPGWLDAFRGVPRQVFVPDGWISDGAGGRLRSSEMTRAEWVDAIHHDVAVIIRDADQGLNSSSAPSVMAKMLDFLHTGDRATVLEIGTGSGYNAALLAPGSASASR